MASTALLSVVSSSHPCRFPRCSLPCTSLCFAFALLCCTFTYSIVYHHLMLPAAPRPHGPNRECTTSSAGLSLVDGMATAPTTFDFLVAPLS